MSVRNNADHREYQRQLEAEQQRAEATKRAEQELETKPRRDAEAAYGTIASNQAEEFRRIVRRRTRARSAIRRCIRRARGSSGTSG
ncbi:hypothetical protein SBA7_880002 [Candidatus Sulfotelmatobacter sp. SbA7]|nr:hypothetical protein SBA7_880002 [Candidatus Sulfotelmatobacter sp. SbA7]